MDRINFVRQQSNKLIRYSIVGVFNTAVTVCIIALLAYLGIHYITYTAIGYIAGMFVSFILNLRFTFKATGYIKKRLVIFFGINLFNLLLVEIIQIVLVSHLHTAVHLAVIIGMIWYVIFGFIMNQLWAFKQ